MKECICAQCAESSAEYHQWAGTHTQCERCLMYGHCTEEFHGEDTICDACSEWDEQG